ncbi:MAG: FixH family protein [Cryomorphaceae bacterium]|nr:FixH family protein [Cryomorphaceae bacterium]
MTKKQSRFRMHWGNSIALVFVLFGIFIGVLVVGTLRQSTDLIEENYYEAEVQYQGRMEEMQRAENLNPPVSLTQNNNRLIIFIPGSDIQNGKAVFKRVDNIKLDFEAELVAGETVLEGNGLVRGNWIVEVSWETEGLRYFKKMTHYQK